MKMLHKAQMKICALFASGLLLAGIGVPAAKNLIPKAAAETFMANGIGYTTNIIRQDVGDFYAGSPVLDSEYLRGNDIGIAKVTLDEIQGDEIFSTSYMDVTSTIKSNTKNTVEGGLSYNAFTANAYVGFENGISQAKQRIISQYYGICTQEKRLYSLTLENSAYFSQAYQDHYNSFFLSKLQQLKNNNSYENYKDFFETNGTHVVVGGVYGGRLDGYYSVYSTTEGFTTDTQNKIKTDILAAFSNQLKMNTSMEYTFSDVNGVSSTEVTTRKHFVAKGGILAAQNNLENGKGYSSWIERVNESNAVLIKYADNGLIPVWKALPSQYANLAGNFEKHFNKYAQEYQDAEIGGLKETELLTASKYSTAEETVRAGEKLITDSDRWTNHYDLVDIQDTFNLNVKTLQTYGFNKVQINIGFNAKRVDDAEARLVFIYQNASKTEDESNIKLLETSFSEITKSYAWKSFSTSKLDLGLLAHDECVIRYRATGAWDDDWKNEKVSAQLIFYKS